MPDLPPHITQYGGFETPSGQIYIPYSPEADAALRQGSGYQSAPVTSLYDATQPAGGFGGNGSYVPNVSGGITPVAGERTVERIGDRLYLVDAEQGTATLLDNASADDLAKLGVTQQNALELVDRKAAYEAQQKAMDRELELEKLGIAMSPEARMAPRFEAPSAMRNERGEVDVYDPNTGQFSVVRQPTPEMTRTSGGNLIIPEGRTAVVAYPGKAPMTISPGSGPPVPDRQIAGTRSYAGSSGSGLGGGGMRGGAPGALGGRAGAGPGGVPGGAGGGRVQPPSVPGLGSMAPLQLPSIMQPDQPTYPSGQGFVPPAYQSMYQDPFPGLYDSMYNQGGYLGQSPWTPNALGGLYGDPYANQTWEPGIPELSGWM